MKNIKIEFTNERIIHASGLAVVGAILLTYLGLLCVGKPTYEASSAM